MSLDAFYRNLSRHLDKETAIAQGQQRQDDVLTFLRFENGQAVCRSSDNTEIQCRLYSNVSPTPGQRIPTLSNGGSRIIVGGGQSGL